MGGFNASYWSFAPIGPYLAAIPYTTNPAITGPYLWSNAGANSKLQIPAGAPGCRVGAAVGQFLMVGDLFQQQTPTLFTGNGTQNTYTGSVAAPMADGGTITDSNGTINGTMSNGAITGTGITSGTVNYATGSITLNLSVTPASGDIISAKYTQVAPYR